MSTAANVCVWAKFAASCQGVALRWLGRTLRRLSGVTVRDVPSLHRLRAVGVDAELCWDVTFGYRIAEQAQAAGRALFDSVQLDRKTVPFSR